MLKSDLLATFVLIADLGSLNAAADKLGLSRSVVSDRLAALEADLNTHLVTRSTRGLSLTPTGELFLEHARALLAAMDTARNAVADADGTLTGRLRITAPAALAVGYLAPLFASFLAMHPRIRIEVSVSDRTIELVQDGFDLGIRSARLPDSDMIASRITSGRRVVVCSPGYAENNGLPKSLGELAQHAALIYRNRRTTQDWTFCTDKGVRSPRLLGRFDTDDGAMLREAAKEGIGVALLPTFIVARDLLAGRLRIVDVGVPAETDTIAAVYPRAHRAIPRIRAVIDHLRSSLGDPPPWDRELAAAGILAAD